MELKEKCDEYVLRNVKTIDIADYESFLQLNNNQEPVLTGLHRGLRDLLSVHAWTTSPEGHQNYLYFQMNGEQKFAQLSITVQKPFASLILITTLNFSMSCRVNFACKLMEKHIPSKKGIFA